MSTGPDPLTGAALHARARKAALDDAIRGRAMPETETVPPSSGFDGGARTPAPPPRDPVRDHDDLIVSLAKYRRVYGGAGDGW